MAIRSSETEASSSFDSRHNNFIGLPKSQPTFLKRLSNKMKRTLSSSLSRIVSTTILIAMFSWFGLNANNVAIGIVSIVHGDMSGFSMIAKSIDIGDMLKESYQVARGFDYDWVEYNRKTVIDLGKDFIYIGSGNSLSESTITIRQMSPDSCEDAYNRARKYEGEERVEKLVNAEAFCNGKATLTWYVKRTGS